MNKDHDYPEVRDVLIEYFSTLRKVSDKPVDHLLAYLWIEGYKIVPLEPSDLVDYQS